MSGKSGLQPGYPHNAATAPRPARLHAPDLSSDPGSERNTLREYLPKTGFAPQGIRGRGGDWYADGEYRYCINDGTQLELPDLKTNQASWKLTPHQSGLGRGAGL